MNNPFCQNKLCRCHVEVPEGKNRMVLRGTNGLTVEVRRIRLFCDKTLFDFCEVCANVGAMLHGVKPKTENQKPNEIREEIRKEGQQHVQQFARPGASNTEGADIEKRGTNGVFAVAPRNEREDSGQPEEQTDREKS